MAKQTFTTGQVLLASQLTSLQQTAMLGGAASAKTASYTLVAADAGAAISMTSTSATTITVNTGLFAAGDTVNITNLGSGVATITAGTATVNSSASLALAQYESGILDFTSASAAIFFKFDGAAAASGGMTLISETVASANSSIDFSSISGSYKQLLLYWDGVYHTGSNTGFGIRFNSDSAANYANYGIRYASSTAASFGGDETSITPTGSGVYYPFGYDINTSGNRAVSGSLMIDNYSSTTKFKHFSGEWQFTESFVAARTVAPVLGYYASTSAITSLNIFRATGSANMTNLANTTIRLYGVS